MECKLSRAIILAGGKGERLRPFTQDKPKAMIPLLDSPLLAFQLKLLSAHGFNEIAICCGYRHEVIADYFGDGEKYGVHIDYLIEAEPLGRGGALRNALEHFKPPADELILAVNGDLLTNVNISEVVAFHRQHNPIATLVAVPLKSPYGIVDLADDASVLGFKEKPELPFWINAGMYILSPAITNDLPQKGDHEVLTFPRLAREGGLKAFRSRSFWKTIDTVKDLTDARNDFEQLLLGAFFGQSQSMASEEKALK